MTTDEPRGLYDLAGACDYLSIKRTKFYELVAAKEIEKVHIGSAPRYPRASLDAYIERLRRAS